MVGLSSDCDFIGLTFSHFLLPDLPGCPFILSFSPCLSTTCKPGTRTFSQERPVPYLPTTLSIVGPNLIALITPCRDYIYGPVTELGDTPGSFAARKDTRYVLISSSSRCPLRMVSVCRKVKGVHCEITTTTRVKCKSTHTPQLMHWEEVEALVHKKWERVSFHVS